MMQKGEVKSSNWKRQTSGCQTLQAMKKGNYELGR
jgi:hypothetical protein